jgi:hypothetical protein
MLLLACRNYNIKEGGMQKTRGALLNKLSLEPRSLSENTPNRCGRGSPARRNTFGENERFLMQIPGKKKQLIYRWASIIIV